MAKPKVDIFKAIQDRNYDEIRSLKKSSFQFLEILDGRSPVMLAAHQRDAEMIELLASKGADVNHAPQGKYNALQLAARDGADAIVACLCALRGNPRGSTKLSALHLAAFNGNAESVRFLCEKFKSIVNLKDDLGRTALHTVFFKESWNCIKPLLAAGAKANLKDLSGRTAIDFAALHPAAAALFREGGVEVPEIPLPNVGAETTVAFLSAPETFSIPPYCCCCACKVGDDAPQFKSGYTVSYSGGSTTYWMNFRVCANCKKHFAEATTRNTAVAARPYYLGVPVAAAIWYALVQFGATKLGWIMVLGCDAILLLSLLPTYHLLRDKPYSPISEFCSHHTNPVNYRRYYSSFASYHYAKLFQEANDGAALALGAKRATNWNSHSEWDHCKWHAFGCYATIVAVSLFTLSVMARLP